MGIVVTIAMLVALLQTVPLALDLEWRPLRHQNAQRFAVLAVLICGLWNVFWYGLQHLSQFWGVAAMGSGFAMIVTATLLLAGIRQPTLMQLLSVALLGFFLLYLVTLVRLNLNLPIIR